MAESSFYLHSNKNCQLYPPSKYTLTHVVDRQNTERYRLKQAIYINKSRNTFLLFFTLILIGTIFFQIHVYIYNLLLFGPFHLNREEFIQHIENYKNGQSWFRRIEYIQIELGEDNILSSSNKYDSIKKYSHPTTGHKHVATYKKVKNTSIYVKLPTRSQQSFHAHLPFDFSSFTVRTLKCIINNLQSNSNTNSGALLEKSEYLKHIKEQYSKNATLFNILVLTKCGILVGYLYRPMYEKAYVRNEEHKFHGDDIAFDVTKPYCSSFLLLMCCFILTCLLIRCLIYAFLYVLNFIRLRARFKCRFLLFPLHIGANIIEELWLLNVDGLPYQQLLLLDELVEQTPHKYRHRLFIIENNLKQLFVILLRKDYNDDISIDDNELSPIIICPVTDIQKIVQYGGICYGNDSSWIPWPSTWPNQENYAEWLHDNLMEISEHYRKKYEHRIHHEQENDYQTSHNAEELCYHSNSYHSGRLHQRRTRRRARITNENELTKYIREEENFQRLKLERQNIFEIIFDQGTPASPRFIANFRIEQKTNDNLIDLTMQNEHTKCIICLEDFQLNDSYSRWPCPSRIPHLFHSGCMLNTLRMNNTCPMCRHPVESAQTNNNIAARWLRSLYQ